MISPRVLKIMEYTLIRSRRKTVSVEVRGEKITVRAPNRATKREADAFVEKHKDWISRQIEKQRALKEQAETAGKLSRQEIDELYKKAAEYIPERVKHYAGLLGVEYGRITVRCQKTRWGSCSTKRNLNFNCLLMLAPPEVIDSVVVHEVCHLREMNHSKRFYALVLSLCPDYYERDRWLKDNGKALLSRLPEE